MQSWLRHMAAVDVRTSIFEPGHQHLVWQPKPRHLNPNTIVPIYPVDHMLYQCLVATLWNADLNKADGGWWCPDGYSVRGHQHPAWWPNPRHINPSSIVSYIYATCDIPIEVEWRIKAASDRSSLVEMVVCRLSGGKPLFKPMLAY